MKESDKNDIRLLHRKQMKMSKLVVGALIRPLLLRNKDGNLLTEANHMVVYLNPPNLHHGGFFYLLQSSGRL